MAERISSFRDLKTWQEAPHLAVIIYNITGVFPDSERFGLANQMRRVAVSVGSNIAEGFSRQSTKDKLQFYHIAKGSLTEIESQLDLAWRVEYIDGSTSKCVLEQIGHVGRLLTALIRKIPVR